MLWCFSEASHKQLSVVLKICAFLMEAINAVSNSTEQMGLVRMLDTKTV